jgi:hypothetical protein
MLIVIKHTVKAQRQDLRNTSEKVSKLFVQKHVTGAGTDLDSLQNGK